MTKRRNKKKAEKPKAKELKALTKKVQQDIVDQTLVTISHTTGQKRPRSTSRTECDESNKVAKHITPSTPYQPTRTPVDPDALGSIFYHPSARTLQARIAAFIPDCTPARSFSDFFNYLFLSSPNPNYESICFCYDEANCGTELEEFCPRHEAGLEELDCNGRYHNRMEIHVALFSYILKRISCLPLIEAENYLVKEDGASATDEAFLYFLRALLSASGMVKEVAVTENTPADGAAAQGAQAPANQAETTQPASQAPEPQVAPATEGETALDDRSPPNIETLCSHGCSHSNSLIIPDPRAIKAFRIFTQHPLRFKVQMKIGQELLKEGRCVVWCTDVGPKGEGGGGWEAQWEYMSKWTEYGVNDEINYQF